MKVSIIVPCYNAQAYLRACLDSLIAQSMEDFEVILIDDGSRDDTAKLLPGMCSATPDFP